MKVFKQQLIVTYLDSVQARLVSHKGMISLRELQSATGEELSALLPSVLRPSGVGVYGQVVKQEKEYVNCAWSL